MVYQLIANVTMVAHFAFLAYVAIGGFLAWRWRRTIWLHVAMATWGFSTVVFHLNCPLTYVEDWARRRAGEAGLTTGFINTYLSGVIYPERYAGLAQILVGAAVGVSWAGAIVLWRRRRTQSNRERM